MLQSRRTRRHQRPWFACSRAILAIRTAVAFVTLATFTDLVAYSSCGAGAAGSAPVDWARRRRMIGLLFASFGVDAPGGVGADGRGVGPYRAAGCRSSPACWRSRRLDADLRRTPTAAVAVRGAAGSGRRRCRHLGRRLCAHRRLYGPEERGRVMGFVMSGDELRLHDRARRSAAGCTRPAASPCRFWSLPPLALVAAGRLRAAAPPIRVASRIQPCRSIFDRARVPLVAVCAAAVVVAGGTIAMLEPVLPLLLRPTPRPDAVRGSVWCSAPPRSRRP